jgi:RNA polymerase sigma factor (TIGR02999 family)
MDKYFSLTDRLQRFSMGDSDIADTVLREVLPTLRKVAAGVLNRERHPAAISPTELINELWLRNLRRGGWPVRDRGHFYNIAASAMRRLLIDFARSRLAERRGGKANSVPIEDLPMNFHPALPHPETVVEIGVLMEQLERVDPKAAKVVDLHYFLGCSLEEISELTHLTFGQTRNHWIRGDEWLQSRLRPYRTGR